MNPTVIQLVSSFFILFLFGFNGDSFLQFDTFTAVSMMDRASKAISGSIMLFSSNDALSSVITDEPPVIPPFDISQCPAQNILQCPALDVSQCPVQQHSWNESCTGMPASVYVPSVFVRPVTARVCFPDGIVDTFSDSTQSWDFPVPESAKPELSGFHLPDYLNHPWTKLLLGILVPGFFLVWLNNRINNTRKTSTVDDGTFSKKGYVDAAIAELSGRIPDLGPVLANQKRLEGQLLQIEGVEARVTNHTDNRVLELETLFKKQIRDIDLEPLTRKADKFQENYEYMSSQIKTLQQDQPRWAELAEQVKDLDTNLTKKIDRNEDRLQKSIQDNVEDINERFQTIESKNEKIFAKIREEQASYNANFDQLKALQKRVADYVTKNSTLQQKVDEIDTFNQQFKVLKDESFSTAEKMRKLQQQVNNIGTSDQRVRGLEDEISVINDSIRKLQQQEVPDIKKVRDVESEVISLRDRVRKLQEQSQADTTSKSISNILERLDTCLTIAQSQEIQTSLSQKISEVENKCLTISRSQEIQTSLNQKISEVENKMRQIPVINTEEERAHTQNLLQNKIETLKIDELKSKLTTVEFEVNKDTRKIAEIADYMVQTESQSKDELTQATASTNQRIDKIVDHFKSALDQIRNEIYTLQSDVKEKGLDRKAVEKKMDDLKTDLKTAEEKVRSSELTFSNATESTRESFMAQINEIKSRLQELDKSKSLGQKQEVPDIGQGRMKIESQVSSQPSQPPQTVATPRRPSAVNVHAGAFVPSPQTPASFSQSAAHSGSDIQAGPSEAKGKGPSTEVISTPNTPTPTGLYKSKWSQPQEDDQKGKQRDKGKQRETPLPLETSGTSWADQVNADQQESSTKNQSTNEKSRKSPAQNTAQGQYREVRPSPVISSARKEQLEIESKALQQVFEMTAPKEGRKTLAESRWAPKPGESE